MMRGKSYLQQGSVVCAIHVWQVPGAPGGRGTEGQALQSTFVATSMGTNVRSRLQGDLEQN
eukprot:1157116-Pelagomonas_calceolata.AAC.2